MVVVIKKPDLGGVNETIEQYNTLQNKRKSLIDRMEKDFGLLRLDKFAIPKAEGEWEEFTTNSPSVLGYKIIHINAGARRKLWVPIEKEGAAERKKLSLTEQFANGAIWQADADIEGIPEVQSSQDMLSFFSAIRGWTAIKAMLLEKDGELSPNLVVWDPLNTPYIASGKSLYWVCNCKPMTASGIELEYGKKVMGNKTDTILVYNVLRMDGDSCFEGVCCGDNPDWLWKEKHDLNHIPVFIKAVGSVPYIYSSIKDDTIRDVGESIFVNNRNIYEIESRLHVYSLDRAGKSAKMPQMIEYDGEKGLPPESEDPYVKGNTIWIDTSKGQKVIPNAYQLPPGESIIEMMERVNKQLSMGGMAPISHGYQNAQLPASGILALIRASLERVYPPKRTMEMAYKWIAKELTGQFTNGAFKKSTLEGYGKDGKRFRSEIRPKDIDDGLHFDCQLVLESIQAELEVAGIVTELVKSRVISMQTARDNFPWIDDPDHEAEIIDRERIYDIEFLKERQVANALIRDGNNEVAFILLAEIEKRKQAMMGGGVGAPPGGNGQGRLPGLPQVGMMAGARSTPPPIKPGRPGV